MGNPQSENGLAETVYFASETQQHTPPPLLLLYFQNFSRSLLFLSAAFLPYFQWRLRVTLSVLRCNNASGQFKVQHSHAHRFENRNTKGRFWPSTSLKVNPNRAVFPLLFFFAMIILICRKLFSFPLFSLIPVARQQQQQQQHPAAQSISLWRWPLALLLSHSDSSSSLLIQRDAPVRKKRQPPVFQH